MLLQQFLEGNSSVFFARTQQSRHMTLIVYLALHAIDASKALVRPVVLLWIALNQLLKLGIHSCHASGFIFAVQRLRRRLYVYAHIIVLAFTSVTTHKKHQRGITLNELMWQV